MNPGLFPELLTAAGLGAFLINLNESFKHTDDSLPAVKIVLSDVSMRNYVKGRQSLSLLDCLARWF